MAEMIDFSKYRMVVVKTEVAAAIRTYYVQIEEDGDAENRTHRGDVEPYGIGIDALHVAYGGDWRRFLIAHVKPRAIMSYLAARHKHEDATALVGQVL